MRTVLCFGDSNTWGSTPGTDERYPREVRWPGRLASALGDEWHVVEEGLPGRTATLDDPGAPGRNGLAYLLPCLLSHRPLDAVVVFLGTNDMADRYSLSAADVARGVARLALEIRRSETGPDGTAPQPIVACPPPVGNTTWEEGWAGVPAKSAVLAERFRAACAEYDLPFVDLGAATRYSDVDGIHLDPDGHAAIARAVEDELRTRFA